MDVMQENAVFARNRHAIILEALKTEGRVYCAQLAKQLQVSEHTVRRDLEELDKEGICRRVHGGAIHMPPGAKDFASRLSESANVKEALGRACALLLKPGALVFIDAGTTNLAVADSLPPDADITVVTNTPAIAMAVMAHATVKLIMVGGLIDNTVAGALGVTALNQIRSMHFDQCVLGVCALDPLAGASVHDYRDAEFKQALVAQSAEVIMAVTSDKLASVASYRIADCQHISHLVVQADETEERITPFSQKGVTIHRASMNREQARPAGPAAD